jgi:hypothetical protein
MERNQKKKKKEFETQPAWVKHLSNKPAENYRKLYKITGKNSKNRDCD